MNLEINKNGNVIINDNNVMMIMKFIAENNISNVRYYITNELGIIPNRYYSKVREIAIKLNNFVNNKQNLAYFLNNM